MPRIIFSFDTEDFVSPHSDDMVRSLAETLTRNALKGSFCMVAWRARALVERGRTDVLDALSKNEIAFHSTWHSFHPTIAEYLDELGWKKGLRRFLAREGEGADEVRRIFGREFLPAAVPPGFSWGPQGIYGYALLGVPIFAGSFLTPPKGQPVWYCNSLNLDYNLYLDRFFKEGAEADLERKLDEMSDCELVVTCNHPTILRHEKFWDAVNFRGKNLHPRGEEEIPPLLPDSTVERVLKTFDYFLKAVLRRPEYEPTTYAELWRLYSEGPLGLSADDLRRAAEATVEKLDCCRLDGKVLSPAECASALIAAGAREFKGESFPVRRLLGPIEESRPSGAKEVERGRLVEACRRLLRANETNLPASVDCGSVLSLAEFVRALAEGVLSSERAVRVPRGKELPDTASFPGLENLHFKKTWSIFPESFEGTELVRLARLQSWGLKPAREATA